jgi:hypothetical protein
MAMTKNMKRIRLLSELDEIRKNTIKIEQQLEELEKPQLDDKMEVIIFPNFQYQTKVLLTRLLDKVEDGYTGNLLRKNGKFFKIVVSLQEAKLDYLEALDELGALPAGILPRGY